MEENGHVHLQITLLSHLKVRGMEIEDTYEGRKIIKSLYCNKKILLVLDDASSIKQLDNLAGNKDWFGAGSRVIITSRDKHLLISHGVDKIYAVEMMNKDEALQLLSRKAFRKDQPKDGYLELSKSVVQYTGRLPLALQVLGSFLFGRSVPEWEDALDKLKKVPNNDILKILKISYDGLDDVEKAIFLDIACFFRRRNKDDVTQILKNCGLPSTIGISVLIEESLLTEKAIPFSGTKDMILEMHDLLQEMGKSIVLQESPNNASSRSRLWFQEDIDQVLKRNMGNETIQGLMISRLTATYKADWDPEALSNMSNLRLLIILDELFLPNDLKCLSCGLKVLQWWKYPLKALPLRTQLNGLVYLRMKHSKLKKLWSGTLHLENLKFIDLSFSRHLTKTPNFSGVPNLETLLLPCCMALLEVHPSLGQLKKLLKLNLALCLNLKALPRKLKMSSLKVLVLRGCFNVRKLPEFGEMIENLTTLDLAQIAIKKLPTLIGFLTSLEELNLWHCTSLVCLPHTIHNLKNLKLVDISGCYRLQRPHFPIGSFQYHNLVDCSYM